MMRVSQLQEMYFFLISVFSCMVLPAILLEKETKGKPEVQVSYLVQLHPSDHGLCLKITFQPLLEGCLSTVQCTGSLKTFKVT